MTGAISIGELADRTGVSPRTIRYYEELGILPKPERTTGGTRRYPREYIFYVRGALALKELGFSLDDISTISLWAMHRVNSEEQIAEAERLVDEKFDEIHERVRVLERVRGIFEERRAAPTPADRRRELADVAVDGYMNIGTLADRTGVSTRTIRYYEELGILPEPPRSGGGTRRYTKDFVFYVRSTLALKELGFTLDEIKLLSDWALGRTEDPDAIAQAEKLVDDKTAELDAKIRLLHRVERILESRRLAHLDGQGADSVTDQLRALTESTTAESTATESTATA